MKVAVNIRGSSSGSRGAFNIQTRVEAETLLHALELVIREWKIEPDLITKVHIQPDAGDFAS